MTESLRVENPVQIAPLRQAKLTLYTKIRLTPFAKIKMSPVGNKPTGDFYVI